MNTGGTLRNKSLTSMHPLIGSSRELARLSLIRCSATPGGVATRCRSACNHARCNQSQQVWGAHGREPAFDRYATGASYHTARRIGVTTTTCQLTRPYCIGRHEATTGQHRSLRPQGVTRRKRKNQRRMRWCSAGYVLGLNRSSRQEDRRYRPNEHRLESNWRNPRFGRELTDDYPACCITSNDPMLFAAR
jgi:hypothetical protein